MSNDTQNTVQEQTQEQVEKTKLIIIGAKTDEGTALKQSTDFDGGDSFSGHCRATDDEQKHNPTAKYVVGRINANGKTATFQKYPKTYTDRNEAIADADKLGCNGYVFGCFEWVNKLSEGSKYVIGRATEDGDGVTFQRWSAIAGAQVTMAVFEANVLQYPDHTPVIYSLVYRTESSTDANGGEKLVANKKKERNTRGDTVSNYSEDNPVSYALTHELRNYLQSTGNGRLSPDTPVNVRDEDSRVLIYRHDGGVDLYHSPLLAAVHIYEFLTSVGYFKGNSVSAFNTRTKPKMVRPISQYVGTDGKPVERTPATRKLSDLNPIAVINQLSNWKEAYSKNNPGIGFPAGTPKRYHDGITCQVLFEGKEPRSFIDLQSALNFIMHFVKTASTNTRKGQFNPCSTDTPTE